MKCIDKNGDMATWTTTTILLCSILVLLILGISGATVLRISGAESGMRHLTEEHQAPLDHFIGR